MPVQLQYPLDGVGWGNRAAICWEEALQEDLKCLMEVPVAAPSAV